MSDRPMIERTAAPLRQQVVKLIREDILNDRLKPGQRLVENALCESLNVSRTVVREALRQLESEHLIEVVANLGPIVRVLTEEDIRSIYVVRANLEGLAGGLFAQNASKQACADLLALRARLDRDYRNGDVDSREEYKAEFYRQLLAGANNKILTGMLLSIHARIAIFRRIAFVDEARIEPSIRELESIIDAAARDRDAQAASDACEHHIVGAGELALIEYIKRTKSIADLAV